MNCETFRDRIFDLLQGSLREREAFDAHRDACAGCRGLLQDFSRQERLLGAARVPMAPPELWPRIAVSIGQVRVAPFRRLRIASFVAAAAALLLVALLGAGARTPAKTPRFELVIQDVSPESRRAFSAFVPRYDDLDTAMAMAENALRNDH